MRFSRHYPWARVSLPTALSGGKVKNKYFNFSFAHFAYLLILRFARAHIPVPQMTCKCFHVICARTDDTGTVGWRTIVGGGFPLTIN